jgi:hypothetical protein
MNVFNFSFEIQAEIGTTLPTSLRLAGQYDNKWPGELYIYGAPWAMVTYHIHDDKDQDGPQNVGFFYVSDCPRGL